MRWHCCVCTCLSIHSIYTHTHSMNTFKHKMHIVYIYICNICMCHNPSPQPYLQFHFPVSVTCGQLLELQKYYIENSRNKRSWVLNCVSLWVAWWNLPLFHSIPPRTWITPLSRIATPYALSAHYCISKTKMFIGVWYYLWFQASPAGAWNVLYMDKR